MGKTLLLLTYFSSSGYGYTRHLISGILRRAGYNLYQPRTGHLTLLQYFCITKQGIYSMELKQLRKSRLTFPR